MSFLLSAPLSFDASTLEIWGPLLNGGRLVISPSDLPSFEELGEVLAVHRVDSLWLTSGLFHRMVDEHPLGLQPLRQLLAGGDVLSPARVRRALEAIPGLRLVNGYGPTENTTFTCCHAMRRPPAGATVPIGRPIAGTRVYVVDPRVRAAPIGVAGELWTGGAGLARGYLGRPAMTAERFVPDPFGARGGERLYRTGDRVRALPGGALEFLGRNDHQVKLRGFRIELGEVEAVLSEHPAVREAAVVVRRDRPEVERLAAFWVPAGAVATAQTLRDFLRARLPEFMVPSLLVELETLPLTPRGKVDRAALEGWQAPAPASAAESAAPRTAVERRLAAIWAEVLGLEEVGLDDNFFELGGDSILSIQIVARANQVGIRSSPRQLFQHQTVRALAAVVEEGRASLAEQGPVVGPVPLTPIQRWFLELGLAAPHHFNQAMLLEVGRELEPAVLAAAARRLLEHHDALRLRPRRQDAEWRQENAAPGGEPPFCRLDLSRLSPARCGGALKAAVEYLQASLDLERGPLLRVASFRLGAADRDRLLIVLHHLAVDGVSWRILLEDFELACGQLSRGEAVALPAKTTSFRQWAERLEGHARSAAVRADLPYWTDGRWRRAGRLPVDFPPGPGSNALAAVRTVSLALDEETTRALLQEVPAAYHTQVNEVLLAALVEAFEPWTGSRVLLLDLEGHGREELVGEVVEEIGSEAPEAGEVDLTRTVGWFTTLFPVLLDLGRASGPGAALGEAKEQLRRIPRRGLSYGLLRYMSGDPAIAERLAALPRAELSFNYHGQVDQTLAGESWLKPAPESRGAVRDPAGERHYLLEVGGVVAEGRLRLSIRYGEGVHRAATVEALAERYAAALEALVEHCRSESAGGYTPSDFSLLQLDQEELDNVFDSFELEER